MVLFGIGRFRLNALRHNLLANGITVRLVQHVRSCLLLKQSKQNVKI